MPELELPAMLYKRDGTMLEWEHKMFDTIIVTDEEEAEIALADGWLPPAEASHDPLDHDGNGRKGGARKAKPE